MQRPDVRVQISGAVESGGAHLASVRTKPGVDVHVLVVALLGTEALGARAADVRLQLVWRVVGEDVARVLAGRHDGAAVLARKVFVRSLQMPLQRVLTKEIK